MKGVGLTALCAAGIAGLAAGSLSGAVYMRLPGGRPPAERIEALGGRRAAAYRMRVNGADADVRVYGFARPPAFVRPALLRAFGGASGGAAPRAAPMLRFEHGGRRSLLMLPALHPDRTAVLLVSFDASADPTFPEYPAPAWPRAPSETLRFSAANRDERFHLTVSDSPAACETARAVAADRLLADGWRPVADALAALPSGGLYGRGRAICYILATPVANGGSRLTVLRAEGPAITP